MEITTITKGNTFVFTFLENFFFPFSIQCGPHNDLIIKRYETSLLS